MDASLKFIHAADLHLGSPLRAVGAASPSLQSRLRDATFAALRRIVSGALEHRADFVILSGDIYDTEWRSVRASRLLADELRRLEVGGIPCFMVYGNHDPVGQGGEPFQLPGGVSVFGCEEVGTCRADLSNGAAVCILGQSYRHRSESRKMYQSFLPPDDSPLNIGVLHTGLDPSSNRYVPCSLSDLESKAGIHYWALGHVHRPQVLRAADPCVVYPGVPQGRHPGETGLGGCMLVTVRPREAPQLQFLPTSEIVWLSEELELGRAGESDLSNFDDLYGALVRRAAAIIEERAAQLGDELPVPLLASASDLPHGYVVRWTVRGRTPLHHFLSDQEEAAEDLAGRLNAEFGEGAPFLWTESVVFRTAAPLPDLRELVERDPVLSELVSLLAEVREDPAHLAQLRDRCGQVWFRPADHEEERPDAFALTDDHLDQLIGGARELIIDRIMQERAAHAD